MLHLYGFFFLALQTLPKRNAFIERLVAPSPAASRLLLYHNSSLRRPTPSRTRHPDSFCLIFLRADPSSSHVLSHFRFGQSWSEIKTLQIFCRVFESTHWLMFLPTSREFLFDSPSSSPWNPPSFIMELTIFSPCSHSDPPFSRQDAALANLDSLPSHDLVMWTDDSVLLPFDKGVLVNCSLCGAEATLSFLAGPGCSSFSLKPAPFCKFPAGLGSTKCAISLFSSRTLALSSPLSSIFPFTSNSLADLAGTVFSPVLSGCNGSPNTRFSREMMRLMSWPDGERYSCPLQSLVVSLLFPLLFILLFSRTGGLPTHLNSSTHRFPRFPLGTCVSSSRLRCSLSSSLQQT